MNGRKKIILSLFIFVVVFILGIVGYKFFGGSDWSWLDSLYMTVITLSTVGFEEVIDLNANPAARVFTVIFIILCLGTIAFAVTSITGFIIEGELKNILGRKRMDKEIAKLKNHYIVCGTDETAQTVIQELLLTRKDFVVIAPSTEMLDKVTGMGDFPHIQGDPAEDDVLLKAGIERAGGILLSLPTDEANLFVSITARSLNPEVRIVTKGIDIRSHKKMIKAGSDAVVSPAFIGGMRMVSEMVRPAVVTFLDMMLRERDQVLRFEEMPVAAESSLVGKSLSDIRLSQSTGALLIAVQRAGRDDYEFNPAPDFTIQADDTLILIGGRDSILEVEKRAGRG